MCAYACGGQQRALDPLEQESQVVLSYPPWVLETELGSLGIAASALNHQVISLAPVT